MKTTLLSMFSVVLLLATFNVSAEAEATEVSEVSGQVAEQPEAVEPEANEEVVADQEPQEQFGFVEESKSEDVEAIFLGVRLGIADSRDVQVISSVNPGEDTYSGASTGFRVGYLLGRFKTYFEYNPVSEIEDNLEVSSYVLATDYAVWRSDSKRHRVTIGAYAQDLTLEYTVTGGSVEIDGTDYGLQAGYRFDVLDWLFVGAEARYGVNNISGNGDSSINIDRLKSAESSQFNLELGVHF